MCLAIPAKVVSLDTDAMATVSFGGVKKRISTALLDAVAEGDYVLVHVGYALHRVSETEAARTLELMAQAGVLDEELEEIKGSAA